MNFSESTSRQVILVTGAARSGKSEWAETLAAQMAKSIIYVATARVDPGDREWSQRIAKHRLRRPASWQTVNVPLELAETISSAVASNCLLIDSLGSWVANFLEKDQTAWQKTTAQLLESLQQTAATVILVAEEVGWGIVPAYASGRQFRDRLGHLVRQIGAIANSVYLVTGGHVLNLSLLGQPLRNYQ